MSAGVEVGGGPAAADAAPRRLAGPTPCVERVAARLAGLPATAEGAGPEGLTAERAAVLEEFWAEAGRRGTPLVEAIDGDPEHRAVTFLWRGHRVTRQVLLLADGLVDRADLAASRLTPLPGTDIWYVGYRLRADHRGSYRMAADISPGEPPASAALLQERLRSLSAHAAPDPLNSRRTPGRWLARDTSVFALPQAPAQPWAEPRDGVARGRVERHRLPTGVLGAERDVWVYLPPGVPAGRLPVLVLCDGDMWFGRLGLQGTLDALAADGALPPLAVLAPDAVDPATRRRELGAKDGYVGFLADELLPWAAGRWPLTTDPARTAVAGQGLGGLAALHAGFLRPERFGNVLAQSPSPLPCPISRRDPVEPPATAVHIDVGLHEGPLVDHTRQLYETLRSQGCPVTWDAYNGGHDYACWRGCLADGLVRLLGRTGP
ncbi:enterochelin esterase [Streptomyces sp. NPDC050658]|uniref:enterochelin esterase n=1 Tax=unclassified Streptomyces TaxID=2593676 RepID=UPI00341D2CD8